MLNENGRIVPKGAFMKPMFLFGITPMEDTVIPQVSQVLEERTELAARQSFPALWNLIDRLNQKPKAPPQVLQKRRKRETFWGVLLWPLSMFLMIPSAMEPLVMPVPLTMSIVGYIVSYAALWRVKRRLLAAMNLFLGVLLCVGVLADQAQLGALILPGLVCVIGGFAALKWEKSAKQTSAVEREASALVQRYTSLNGLESMFVSFEECGMVFKTEHLEEIQKVSYETFGFVAETEDLLVSVYEEKGLILQKKDLKQGNMNQLREFLQSKVRFIRLDLRFEEDEKERRA